MQTMDLTRERLMGQSPFLRSHATGHLETEHYLFHHFHAGSGMPLVMVHGGGMWLYSFRLVAGPLSRTHAVYALDMPGYGYTVIRHGSDQPDPPSMPAALKEYLDALGVERTSFVGHSWGGGWVLAFALAYPERVDRVVLIDSSGLDVPDVLEWELLKVPLLGRIMLSFLTTSMVRRKIGRSFHDPSMADDDMAMEVRRPLLIPDNRRTQCAVSRGLSWKDVESGLPALSMPVLLIWGSEDRYLDVSLTARFRERIQGLKVEILDGCGHSPHEERPDCVAGLIRDFLDGT